MYCPTRQTQRQEEAAVKGFVAVVIGASLLAGFCPAGDAAEITGAGSTFVNPIMLKWSAGYSAATGNVVSYQSIGSGGGISKIKAATVDFGASDMPLKSEELAKVGLGQFPLVIGGVVPVINIDGVKPGQLKFTGALLADIFLGKIRKWNDPALRALNPDVRLPDASITVVHRSDGSGTTFNWVNYLSKTNPEWRDKVGEGTSVDWPTGVGGKGNEGVAVFVGQIKNSIGYVEYAYAVHYKMIFGLVQNRAGRFVTPDAESFQAAAEGFDWTKTQDFYLVMTDAEGERSYPITATTFILISKKPKELARSKLSLEFFKWALEHGQQQAQELDYVPLPSSLVTQIEAYWKANVDAGM
jgi:phosphate transport system substrate-binding protein